MASEGNKNRLDDSVALDKFVEKEAKTLLDSTLKNLARAKGVVDKEHLQSIEILTHKLQGALSSNHKDDTRRYMQLLSERSDQHLAEVSKTPFRDYFDSVGVAILVAVLLRAFTFEAFKIPSSSMVPTLHIGDHLFVNKIIYGLRIPFTTIKFFDFRKPKKGEVIVFINPCVPEKDYIKRVIATEGDTVEVRCDQVFVNQAPIETQIKDKACTFWDSDESGANWWEEDCSSYLETHGGATYETLYEDTKPIIDEARKNGEADSDFFSMQSDFPFDVVPNCPADTDPRDEAQKQTSMGELISAKDADAKDLDTCVTRQSYKVPEGHAFVMGDNRHNSLDSRSWGVVPFQNVKGRAAFVFASWRPLNFGGFQFDRMGKDIE